MTAARVLTIEDEPTIRSGIVAYLEDSGFEMLEADDGVVGLDMFRQEKPDAVLCDLRLPGMDGLDVLGTITSESPETPVIIVSGVSELGYAVHALKRGAWDYVTKPIQDMGVLENALERVLERAALMRRTREYRENLERLNRELQADEEAGRRVQFQLLPENNRRFGEYVFTRQLFPSMYLSGDFVDYFAIDGRQVAFYIADVSGHGVASAFVTVMLKTLVGQYRESLWHEGDETVRRPADALRRLNRDLRQQSLDHYVTMYYGVLDLEQNTLAWSSGGHFPHPILHDGEEARAIPCRGRPVGLFDDSEYSLQTTELPDRFDLWLVSDGVLEILQSNSLKQKQADLIARVSEPGTTIKTVSEALGLEMSPQLPDDITFLMVNRGAVRGKR